MFGIYLNKFLCAVFISTLLICSNARADELPDAGNTISVSMSKHQEQVIGDRLMRNMRHAAPLIQDPIINDYISQLGTNLENGIDSRDMQFSFFVLEANSVNAFALPGGYIGIHTGLITTAQSEAELAAVTAHEIAHVTQRHLARMFERSRRYTWPTVAAAVGSILLATQNPAVGQSALAATLAGSQQAMINFTRENEQEADRIGIEIMAKAGYDPRAMPSFFERMATYNRYMPNLPEFLSTHPVTEKRIADSRRRAEKYPAHPATEDKSFHLVQQRIAIKQEDNPQQAVLRLSEAINNKQDPHIYSSRYGYVLSLTRIFQLAEAEKQVQLLIAEDPNKYLYQLAAADIEALNKKYAAAIARLQTAQVANPNTSSIPMQIANTALSAGNPRLARSTLQQYLRNHKEDTAAYELLIEANSDLGDSVGAHQAQAESFALEGDFKGAIAQLDSAEKLANKDKYTLARIKARKTQFEKTLKEEKA